MTAAPPGSPATTPSRGVSTTLHDSGVGIGEVEMKFPLERGLRFSFAQFMLRQMHRNNLSVRIKAKYWVYRLSLEV